MVNFARVVALSINVASNVLLFAIMLSCGGVCLANINAAKERRRAACRRKTLTTCSGVVNGNDDDGE